MSPPSDEPYAVKIEGSKVPVVVPKKILVFAPHPDDELISCGGTILKYSSLGSEIVVVFMTSGLGGYAKEEDKGRIASVRQEEYKHAVQSLHIDECVNLEWDEVEINRETVSTITGLIRDQQPDLIFSPHVTDTHRSHRNTAEIVKESVYHAVHGKAYGGHARGVLPKGYYTYESPSCKFSYVDADVFCIVDISTFWQEKVGTFNKVYHSQAEVLERIMAWAEKTARLRGDEIFCEFGEAFIPQTEYVPLSILIL
ncbi:MAG: PIG-L family deacetylase [Candidatus Lokiarchaeota archaeon]|nr:PIG-L family deacetylase [Candidatus Lokiarchaeota archaeon]